MSSAHSFERVHFSSPTWCRYCGEFIWGLGKQGFACTVCQYPTHTRCWIHVPNTCSTHTATEVKLTSTQINTLVTNVEGRVTKDQIHQMQKLWNRVCTQGEASFEYFKEFYKQMAEDTSNFDSLPVAVTDTTGLQRLFTSVDANKDGKISFEEYVCFAAILNNPKPEELVKISFALMDHDSSGFITKEELYKALGHAQGMNSTYGGTATSPKSGVQQLVDSIFEMADENKDGKLTLEEVLNAAKKNPSFISKFCV